MPKVPQLYPLALLPLGRRYRPIKLITSQLPLGYSLFQPSSLSPAGGDQLKCLVGIDTQGAAAVGDDQEIGRQFIQSSWQFIERDGSSSREMASLVFLPWANIEKDDIASFHAFHKRIG